MLRSTSLGIVMLLFSPAIAVARAIRGSTVFDSRLAGNTAGTFAIISLIVVGILSGWPGWIDIGLIYAPIYALLNLLAMLAILQYLCHGDLACDPNKDGNK